MKNNFNTNELMNYSSSYSESGFWAKLRTVAKKAGEKVVYVALVLYYELADPEVTIMEKSVIIGALGYFILPVDLIPDTIPVLGYTDDFAALQTAYSYVSSHITPSVKAKAQAKLSRWFG